MDERWRVMRERVPQVYCGYCRASWPGAHPPKEAVRHLQEAHGVTLTQLGVDLWQGDRYGPGTGHPKRRPPSRPLTASRRRPRGVGERRRPPAS